MNVKTFTICTLAAALMWGCTDDTFAPDSHVTPQQATPSNLVYPEAVNAREYALITSGLPTLDCGGLIPTYEITAGYDADGNALDASYMSFVTIANPTVNPLGTDDAGNPLEGISYRKAGQITIATGNPFAHGDYSFDVKATTDLNGTLYSTTFPKGAKFHIGPALPGALLYIPMAQNLVIGAGTSTTAAYMPSGNADVTYSLGSDDDKLTIDATTGKISLKAGYSPAAQVTITPTVLVTSNISNETVTFAGGASLLSIVVSSSPVVLPLQEKYFFTPTLEAENLTYGYRKYIVNLGSFSAASGAWTRQAAAAAIATWRPADLKNNYSLMNNSTQGTAPTSNLPHDSWIIFTPQNLSLYNYGFELSATFWLQNQYVAYMAANGKAPCELRIMVSTNYTSSMTDPTKATWTDVTSILSCDVVNGTTWTDVTTGLPYPGTNALLAVDGSTDNDQAKDRKNTTYNWVSGRWVRCVLDLEEYKNSTSFTLAIHQISNYEGYMIFANNLDRPGRFTIADVYYKAKEKAANP